MPDIAFNRFRVFYIVPFPLVTGTLVVIDFLGDVAEAEVLHLFDEDFVGDLVRFYTDTTLHVDEDTLECFAVAFEVIFVAYRIEHFCDS